MRFLDLFAGIGGFRLGMERAGHECVGYVEWDKFARKSYEAIHNTEGEWTAHDITTVTDGDLELLGGKGIDVICGGFPCQAFSVAGKRGGFDDTRGTMFFQIARFAKQIKPRLLLLENVKGLLSHDQGNTFGTILHTLDELGYDTEWQVLNSKDFGVPQNRERVFIVGHLRGERRREVFPITETDGNSGNEIKRLGHSKYFRRVLQTFDTTGSCEALDTMQGGNRQPCIRVLDDQGRRNKEHTLKDIVPTLRAQSHGNEPKIIQKAHGFNDGGIKEIAPTLTKNSWEHNNHLTDGYKIRKLTPKECWRLQGFPDLAFDKAAEVNSDSQLYKQAGNSVSVPVIYEIAKRLGS